MVVVFFIPTTASCLAVIRSCQAIRLLVVTVVFPTNLVLDVAMIIRGLVVGIAGSLISCVAVIRGCQAIRLLVVTVVFPTNLILDVAMIIRGLVVGIAGSLVSCVAVIRACQAVATATVGTGLVVAIRIIATLLIVVVW